MNTHFDVIVIGTGPAGSKIATTCANANKNVAIIESRGYGGTCPLRGCIPKKVLTSVTDVMEQNNQLHSYGIKNKSSINWKALMDYKRTFTDAVPESMENNMQQAGITTFHGEATFMEANQLKVGTATYLTGDKIVIATGAEPAELPIDGAEHLITSDDFLELENLPQKIVFIGGGYVSFELAHIAARAGSEVHILQRGARVLKSFDEDLVQSLLKRSEQIGVHVHLNAPVEAIAKSDNEYTITTNQNNNVVTFTGDLVVHGAGRIPNVEKLQPEQGEVTFNKAGITVNEFLQSVSNPHVYAAGDAANTEGDPLTPVGSLEAETLSANLLHGEKQTVNYTGTPSVVFASPKLAKAGINADDRNEDEVNIHYTDAAEFFTYKHMQEEYAEAKIITDANDEYILGAHLISNQADELINYFAMAIQLKIKTADLKNLTYVFPTAVSDIPSFL